MTTTEMTRQLSPFDKNVARFKRVIEKVQPSLAALNPDDDGALAQRIAKLAFGHLTGKNADRIANCTPRSVALALMACGELGLEPGAERGLAYLVPYGRELKLMIGYKGYLELAYRSARVKRINATVIYGAELAGNLVQIQIEPPDVQHAWAPGIERNEDDLVACYAVVELRGGGVITKILERPEVEKRRANNARWQKPDSPWQTEPESMWRKTAVRALLASGLVPLSNQMEKALQIDGGLSSDVEEMDGQEAGVVDELVVLLDGIDDQGAAE